MSNRRMRSRFMRLGSALAAIALMASFARAETVEQVKPVFEHGIPNAQGKKLVAILVTYPPAAKSPAHHHAASAFIFAYVISGSIRSRIDDGPVTVYNEGDSFYEAPGSHHRISENASDALPSVLLAVFVVDSNDAPLTVPDEPK